jgi:V/A-type H+-transporting ATPase subunit E
VLSKREPELGDRSKMTYENLIESMEVSAEKRINEILKNAHEQGDEIRKTALTKAQLIKAAYREEAQKSVDGERNKLIYQVKAENKMNVIKEKDRVIKSAFAEVKKRLDNFRNDENYHDNFKKMLQEAVRALETEKVVLHIDKRDESLCRQVLNELNINSQIVADLTSGGGLVVSTKDGKIVVFNTVESRLAKAEELMRREIFATLYGD